MQRRGSWIALGILGAALASAHPVSAGTAADVGKRAAAINAAPFAGGKPSVAVVLRAQAWLARARFSPGALDGKASANFTHVLEAYQRARGLAPTAVLDQATWDRLAGEPSSARPVAMAYTLTPKDLAGPFAPDVGSDLLKLAALPRGPQFSTPLEALATRFHLTQDRLAALNPGVDFRRPGARILVIDAAPAPFRKGDVSRVRVSRRADLVAAFDARGRLIAAYPATVGSRERPSPSGAHKVVSVSLPASYVYDPARLTWGPRAHQKFTIKPGPKNPIGTVWIALDAPTYGIHGSPKAELIGKTASHGCVRLTNWDAESLAAGVLPGVTVEFRG